MALGANAIRVLTTLCVVAATVIILLPLLSRPAARPIHPVTTTTRPARADRVLDERMFGASPDSMILYTPPGFRGANERHAPQR
ncbi:MAG TPA: hypothetical protein VKB50_12050 [Vicinamibacterales bacterium]|nr:hypothetical protein [Vicinamibacterales bacterium]